MTTKIASLPIEQSAPDFAPAKTYRISIRDLRVDWRIGVFDHEHDRTQPVLINIALEARALPDWAADDYSAVPCYSTLAGAVSDLAGEGHVELVETLAHKIAALCLEDARILSASVRIEKPDALRNAAAVGVEVTLNRT